MSHKVTSLLSLALLITPFKCQESVYRLPQTILPTNYQLQLHPDIVNDVFDGVETIQIDITPEYFNNLAGNFDVLFNYYPSQTFSSITLLVDGINEGEYDLAEALITNDTTQIVTAEFNITKTQVQTFQTAGNTFSIYIEFTGAIRGGNDLAGWYKSQYENNGVTVTNLVTQFQATDARSVFPCFDEPAFKATFDVTFIAPVDAVKLSNMEIDGDAVDVAGVCAWTSPQGESKDDCVSVTFKQTEKMSTYLLAFVIGGYLYVDEASDGDNENPKQTVYYPYIFAENRAQFALDESIKVLDKFSGSDGFDINFTLDKLDSIGVNDFAAGAMENWGLIIYRTARLLVDEDISSQASKSGQILIIAHELAHQWFGNLVSPAWWDDLWLNEGFATYMAYYGGNMIQPGYTLNENKVQAITKVMIDDSSVFTPAVKQVVPGAPEEILSLFNSVTYQKGMGVINTIANVMGNDEFLVGIHKYLDQYQFDTATSAQLGAVLDGEFDGISELMDSFILQAGFPLISVDTVEDGASLVFTIDQERFVKQGPRFYEDDAANTMPFVTQEMVDSFSAQLWRVPFFWRDAEGGLIEISGTVDNMMLEAELTSTNPKPEFYIVNPIDGDPQKVNEGLFNFFRVQYDDYSLKLLTDNWSKVGKQNQFTIISDRFALMQAQYITPESYLDFIRIIVDKMLNDLAGELPEYTIFNVIIESFIYIDDIYCELVFEHNTDDDRALRGYFREFASDIARKVLGLVVDDIKKPFRIDHEDCPQSSDCNILKSVSLKALVRFMDEGILYAAYELFYACANRVCDQPALCYGCDEPKIEDGRLAFVEEDVLQAFIAGVLAYNVRNDATLNDIIDLYDLVNIEQQTYILSALGAVYQDPNKILVTKALDFIMSPTVRSNMKVNALVGMKVCTAREPLWSYMTTKDEDGNTVFDSLFASSGLFSQEPLSSLFDGFASEEKHDEVQAFFADENRVNVGTERIVSQTLENVYTRYLWKLDTQPGMETYMRTFIVDKYKDTMKIWQIIVLTLGCCGALILLVVAFWAVSRPSESDRFVYYLSLKREKREEKEKRKKSSLSQGAGGAVTTSLGDTMDRSIRPTSLPGQVKQDVVEEKQPTVVKVEKAAKTGTGYGATQD